jgi:phenylacetate-CoA ligase
MIQPVVARLFRESAEGVAVYPEGAVSPSWGYASTTIASTGPMVGLNVASTLDQQAEWLQRHEPDYLLTHPTIAHALAEHFRAHGLRLVRLKQIITIAENLRPEVRAACKAAWNVPIMDIYSAREVGYIGLQCPEHEHHHVQSEGVFVEVVDADGAPGRAGEAGHVLVTPLHNFGMPLIRYDIGDQAEMGEACSCGRGLPIIRRILGRTQIMIVLPSGERRWPLLSSDNIETMLTLAPAIRQYQFVQKSLETMELRLVVDRPLLPAEENALVNWVRTKFAHPFHVQFAYLDALPRTPAGKFEDFVSEVAHQPEVRR